MDRTKNISRAVLAGVLLLGALVWISLNVWTVPVALLWHAFHGNSVSFEGHDIRVPWDMVAYSSPGPTISLVREAPKYSLVHSPAGMILVARTRGPALDLATDYDKISKTNSAPPSSSYRFTGTRQLSGPKGNGYCWEIIRVDLASVSITCAFDKDTITASYSGSPDYRDRFYETLTAVSQRLR